MQRVRNCRLFWHPCKDLTLKQSIDLRVFVFSSFNQRLSSVNENKKRISSSTCQEHLLEQVQVWYIETHTRFQ